MIQVSLNFFEQLKEDMLSHCPEADVAFQCDQNKWELIWRVNCGEQYVSYRQEITQLSLIQSRYPETMISNQAKLGSKHFFDKVNQLCQP